MDILSLRKKIDQLDEQILILLSERARIAQEIGKLKAENNTVILNPDRERQVISHVLDKNQGPLSSQDLERVFMPIIQVCRSIQSQG